MGLHAQSSAVQDSLRAILSQRSEDTSKVWRYHDLAKTFHTNDQDSTLYYLMPALELSKRLDYSKGEAASVIRIAATYFMMGNHEKYQEFLSFIPALVHKPDLGLYKGKLYSKIANNFFVKQMYDSSFYYFTLTEKAYEETGYPYQKWMVYYDIAKGYWAQGKREERDRFMAQAYEITSARQNRKDHGFLLYHLMKYAYQEDRFEDYASYLEEYRKLLNKDPQTGNNKLIHPFHAASTTEPAEIQLDKRIKLLAEQKRMKHSQSMIGNYFEIIRLLRELNRMEDAFAYTFEAQEVGKQVNRIGVKLALLQILAELYESSGKYQLSLAYHKQAKTISDSLQTLEAEKSLQELAIKYETEKQEKELAASQFALEKASLSNRGLTLTASLVGILAIIALYFLYFKSKTNRLLEQKNTTIAQSLHEKETLLREIHHRVKNNLQVVSSLLSLQSDSIQDAKARQAFQEGQDRVYSMTLIHQNLYQTDNLTSMDIREYIGKLADSLFHSYNIRQEHIQLSIEAEPLLIDVDTLIPIGLILNELLSNALKHAFPPGEHGQIEVIFKKDNEALLLSVKDDGVGIPTNSLKDHSTSFGMTLIKSFAKKLNAEFIAENQGGTSLSLRIHNYQLAS
ncbi:MAG: sensor histidine kinase [Bacteroidota bacterium]